MNHARWPARVLVTLLVVIAAVTAWDYIEVLRLERELARIEAAGEPTTAREFDATITANQQEETTASRYYRAAIALKDRSSSPGDNLFHARMERARLSNEWPADVLQEMRRLVRANDEALLYLDKAAALPFRGFTESGSAPAPQPYELHTLLPLTEMRTTVLAIEGKSAEAAASLFSAVRMQRAMAQRSDPFAVLYLTRQAKMLVSKTRPQAEDLALLAEGFAALDNDDLLRQDLLWLRATSQINVNNPYWWRTGGAAGVGAFKIGESIAASIQAPLYRPFLLHRVNERLRDYSDLIAAQAGKRWPDKLDALAEYTRTPFVLSGHGQSVARELALIRSARTIVAIEQYRRANGERVPTGWNELSTFQAPLIDPFSGQPLKILITGDRYVVYSLGLNRRDDAGSVDAQPSGTGRFSAPAQDLGISVTLN